ncbi:hypothetical protein CRG98_027843 [Punica granatum]|uniref:Uncharacterized protein n=1 Tax=Punica granatum TaxID=22663 RepID=A0A2I0J6C5_PUNGR|nr:hypothetical protein CRG98_027843 [Punica granatum]
MFFLASGYEERVGEVLNSRKSVRAQRGAQARGEEFRREAGSSGARSGLRACGQARWSSTGVQTCMRMNAGGVRGAREHGRGQAQARALGHSLTSVVMGARRVVTDVGVRTFLIHINLGLSRSYNGKGPWDGFDVTKDQTDVTEDRIDVTRDEFEVPRDELDVTRDELDVTRDEFDVSTDKFDVASDEFDVTRDELDVTWDEFDVTRDDFDVTRDEFDVTFFSGTQMMQFA